MASCRQWRQRDRLRVRRQMIEGGFTHGVWERFFLGGGFVRLREVATALHISHSHFSWFLIVIYTNFAVVCAGLNFTSTNSFTFNCGHSKICVIAEMLTLSPRAAVWPLFGKYPRTVAHTTIDYSRLTPLQLFYFQLNDRYSMCASKTNNICIFRASIQSVFDCLSSGEVSVNNFVQYDTHWFTAQWV